MRSGGGGSPRIAASSRFSFVSVGFHCPGLRTPARPPMLHSRIGRRVLTQNLSIVSASVGVAPSISRRSEMRDSSTDSSRPTAFSVCGSFGAPTCLSGGCISVLGDDCAWPPRISSDEVRAGGGDAPQRRRRRRRRRDRRRGGQPEGEHGGDGYLGRFRSRRSALIVSWLLRLSRIRRLS